MYCKYYLKWGDKGSEKHLFVEDFGDAFVCEGRVFFRETVEHSINTLPGQCWGDYIDLPAGCFLDGEWLKCATSLCIDDVGQSYIVTEIVSTEPLYIKSVRHIGVDACGGKISHRCSSIAELIVERKYDKLCISGIAASSRLLLIPAEIDGMAVAKVDLSNADLSMVETLIISEGIDELSLNFYTAERLTRLVLPDNIRLTRPLDYISNTPWFRAQPPKCMYIATVIAALPAAAAVVCAVS